MPVTDDETATDFFDHHLLLLSPFELTDEFDREGEADGFATELGEFADFCVFAHMRNVLRNELRNYHTPPPSPFQPAIVANNGRTTPVTF